MTSGSAVAATRRKREMATRIAGRGCTTQGRAGWDAKGQCDKAEQWEGEGTQVRHAWAAEALRHTWQGRVGKRWVC